MQEKHLATNCVRARQDHPYAVRKHFEKFHKRQPSLLHFNSAAIERRIADAFTHALCAFARRN